MKTTEGRIIALTVFLCSRKGKKQKFEREFSFRELIGFDKTDSYFQETKLPAGKI
jgi:hypothetical protein